jgi:hypothetical protein
MGGSELEQIRNEPGRPGKYEGSGSVGEFFHDKSLDGWADEEVGDATDGLGHAALLTFADDPIQIVDNDGHEIVHAVIVYTDTQGFVDVDTFTSVEAAETHFSKKVRPVLELPVEDE